MQTQPKSLTYISFAIPGHSLGVVILHGEYNVIDAAREAHRLGINPGGEVVAVSCTDTDEDVPKHLFKIMAENANRLIHPGEARELFDAVSIEEFEEAN